MTHGAVWVTRPAPGNAATATAIRDAGYRVLDVPVLEVMLEAPEGLPGSAWPDWILFVSVNAVAGLERALAAGGGRSGDRANVRVGVVGRVTADAARRAGWTVSAVPEMESASGLLEALQGHSWDDVSVWIPAGNLEGSARDELPGTLRARGAEVEVVPVYRTVTRPLPDTERKRLDAAEPGAVVVHSPSAAGAVLPADPPATLERWRAAAFVAVGPRTGDVCRRLGAARVHVAAEPSDRGILDVLAGLPGFVPEKERR